MADEPDEAGAEQRLEAAPIVFEPRTAWAALRALITSPS
jgi:hypothetical protein